MHQYLVPHNTERSKLGLPPLKWSKKLESYASWWARQRREDCSLIHSNIEYGENLFWGSGHDWKPSDAVRAWAKESCYYNHKTNSCEHNKQDCLHYTQMVWRQSSKIGCAKVVCKSGDTIFACVYDPPGNEFRDTTCDRICWKPMKLRRRRRPNPHISLVYSSSPLV
ncbi:hypothetical protein ACLB2K_032641 [Fragaria x ananassa]